MSANTCLTFGSLPFFTLVSSLSRINFESTVELFVRSHVILVPLQVLSGLLAENTTEILLLVTIAVA